MPWTDEELERLKDLWENTTLSVQAIANAMKKTKGSIIGKVHRQGLSSRKDKQGFPGKKEKKKDRRHNSPVNFERLAQFKRAMGRRPLVAVLDTIVDCVQPGDVARVTFRDLKIYHCRWPIAEGYCGDAAPGPGPYCEHHTMRARRIKD